MKKELKEFLLRQQFEGDWTEGTFDLLDILTKGYKKILMKLLEETPKKKTCSDHWCVFSHYFWTLKSTVSMKRTSRVPPWLMNKRRQRKVKRSFKIKIALPEQKTADIKKNGNVIKTIRVRRKTKYFNDRNAKAF